MVNLAVYIHWPFCKSKCPYCDFNSHVRESVDQERWKEALIKELETTAEFVPNRQVTSIFFGGGTPSLMPPATAEALIGKVHELWKVAPNIEITLEANPTSVEAHTFPDFAKAGINRVSLGVQSFDDKELKFLGRGHSAKEAMRAIELAQQHFARYSFDLIYARPNQTADTWRKELSEALSLAGKHLSLYQLTIEENTAFHHAYAKGEFALPNEEESEALYRITEEMMNACGLFAYEVSNYASPGEESRHNLSYWKGDDYIGIGPGAHGRISADFYYSGYLGADSSASGAHVLQTYAPLRVSESIAIQHRLAKSSDIPPDKTTRVRIATQTIKSPERWLEAVTRESHAREVWQEINKEQEIEERVMMGLRLREGISLPEFKEQTGIDLLSHMDEKKRRFYIKEGLLSDDPLKLQTTLKGRLVLNRLTADLLV